MSPLTAVASPCSPMTSVATEGKGPRGSSVFPFFWAHNGDGSLTLVPLQRSLYRKSDSWGAERGHHRVHPGTSPTVAAAPCPLWLIFEIRTKFSHKGQRAHPTRRALQIEN